MATYGFQYEFNMRGAGAYALAFSPGEFQPAFSNLGVVSIREVENPVVDVGRFARRVHIGLCGFRLGIEEIIHYASIEQNSVLWNNADIPAKAVKLEVLDVVPINGDGATRYVIEAIEKPQAG